MNPTSADLISLERCMTRHPHTIRVDEQLKVAAALMKKLGVRHLPVLDAGRLVGVLSDRDLKLAGAFKGTDMEATTVEDACVEGAFAVDIDTSVQLVTAEMAERRIGSVLVTEEGKLVGIFTTTDACRALSQLLAQLGRS